ncbi:unnamed protein product [Prorocentrum cordatum]|uniref:Uncharacterized protein n=1 Tax=Prorocentrum cordatum TaxID=2364126 RepID=A0ABN9V5B0_9DINO|nr:unnamed protein product [Polarella glacialis]
MKDRSVEGVRTSQGRRCEEHNAGGLGRSANSSFNDAMVAKQKRHARKHLESSVRESVLQRYADSWMTLTRRKLLQHTCHVCAWVGLLPAELAVRSVGRGSLSPVRVLTGMLRRRGPGRLTPRLRAALIPVRDRLAEVFARGAPGSALRDWSELRHVLPLRSALKIGIGAEHCAGAPFAPSEPRTALPPPAVWVARDSGHNAAEKEINSKSAVVRQAKMWRRLAKKQEEFHKSSQQAIDVKALLKEATEACESGNALRICRALLEGVAWLAKPRRKLRKVTGQRMTEDAQARIEAALQAKIRAVILACLRSLDLDDEGTQQRSDVQVSVRRLKSRMDGLNLHFVAARKEWSAIASCIAQFRLREATGRQKEDTSCSTSKHKVRVGKVGVAKVLIRTALWRLGGEGISQDVVECIKSDSGLFSIVETSMNTHETTGNTHRRGEAVWEVNVKNSMAKETVCKFTGRKRQRRGQAGGIAFKIFQLRPD